MTTSSLIFSNHGMTIGKHGAPKGVSYEERYGVEKALEIRMKISKSLQGYIPVNVFRKGHKTYLASKETRSRVSTALWLDPEYRRKQTVAHLGITPKYRFAGHHSEETKLKISQTMKVKGIRPKFLWTSENNPMNDPVKAQEIIQAAIKASHNRPSPFEAKYIRLFGRHGIQLDYVGDGRIFIARRNPDFINTQTRTVVEVAYKLHKEFTKKIRWFEWEAQTKEHYLRHGGWECLVIWSDMPDETALDLIKTILCRRVT